MTDTNEHSHDHNAAHATDARPPYQAPERWHIAREIPLAVLVTLVLQTGAGIWFFGQMSARLDAAIEVIRELKIERYTREDARRDRELMAQMFQSLQLRDSEIALRLEKIEARHERDASERRGK
jgi:uncharacterized protein HemX